MSANNLSQLPELVDAVFAPARPARLPSAKPAPSLANDFWELTKPRMNFLIVVTTAVGFCLAARHGFAWGLFICAAAGTALTAASAAVINQLIERRLDMLMARTANRPLAAGRISPRIALPFSVLLGVSGVGLLLFFVNPLTAALGAFTLISYVALYTPLKRISTLCTVVGAIPGGIPPVMGWTAVTASLSPGAVALFAILFIWQMPHFLAIAILYKDDYAAGGFKMLPCVDPGLRATSRQIVIYSLALIPVSILPNIFGLSGQAYFYAAILLGLSFLSFAISTAISRSRPDARKLFFASIIYLPLLLGAMIWDKL